ncbi:hypothetical protein ABZ079_04385 [Streptomyces sp. NPDC006314]|uniref:hypothetical protein n=1 Tax=Streptomyces sp. NPDC006314 TaxID=3154475 RepID=UPI0033B81DE4
MTDQTTGSGDERYPTGRSPRTPDDARAPEDAARGRTPREARPEERLTGEPAPGESAGRVPGEAAGGRQAFPAGAGREGLTADDRTPQDTAQPPPGPAGTPTSGDAAGPGSAAHGMPHGSEGLRPGTEDLGRAAPGTPGTDADEEPVSEKRRMPDDGLGAASAGGVARREAGTTGSRTADTGTAAPGGPAASGGTAAHGDDASGTGAPLLPHDEMDRFEQRMRQVVAGFVDEPRGAVEEADRALEEIAARFSEAVTRRRRTLRMSWEGTEERGPGAETDTERLRLALRDYRELAGRLLHS